MAIGMITVYKCVCVCVCVCTCLERCNQVSSHNVVEPMYATLPKRLHFMHHNKIIHTQFDQSEMRARRRQVSITMMMRYIHVPFPLRGQTPQEKFINREENPKGRNI